MIGSFYQPEAVIYDTDFLRKFTEHEKRSGFAEVIKHGSDSGSILFMNG